jgi:predicted Rossmann fold nucleotide-binding protein DprA/Smf involved in DNA uptake
MSLPGDAGTGTFIVPADAVSRLRLIRTDSIGPVTYRQLIARFGDAETALKALPDLARRGNRSLARQHRTAAGARRFRGAAPAHRRRARLVPEGAGPR